MVAEPMSVGMNAGALAEVERLFDEQIHAGQHPGAALAVYRRGHLVLDLARGVADVTGGRPVTADTMFVLFSSTKPLASVAVLQQIDRGKAGLDDPVAKFWPAFGANGKDGVTIRHILTHRGGFPETPEGLTWDRWCDWDAVVQALESAPARWQPGTVSAYHALNHGWVCAELVRRIDGRDFPTYLRAEITGPLGMPDTHVGLPPQLEERVAVLHAMEDVEDRSRSTITTFNRPEVHQAVVPAGCGIATARDMARFYAALAAGGELDGRRIIGQETLARAQQAEVEDEDRSLEIIVRRGLGFNLGGLPGPNRMGRTSTARTFGHGGAGTSICWGDTDLNLGFTFIPNGFREPNSIVQRCEMLSDAVRKSVMRDA
jgi:CubicO group peptidase (beta-lactamase class C family)